MPHAAAWIFGMAAIVALPVFSQTSVDPFTQYDGRILEGCIQNMAANANYFILHRVLGKDQEIVESWAEGQLTVCWQKTFMSVGSEIVLDGGRVAFTAAETLPSSKSVGLHVFDTGTGGRILYTRADILGHAGRFLAASGDSIFDMTDGSVVFGSVSGVR